MRSPRACWWRRRPANRSPPYEYDAFDHARERMRLQVHTLKQELHEQHYNRDPLTGTKTRISLLTELREQHELVRRGAQPCTLALIAIDHFKAINDTHGHASGDKVLTALGHALQEHLRPYDKVFRYGGEEFLMGFPALDARAALGVSERLRTDLARTEFEVNDGARVTVTVSFGIAALDAHVPVEASLDRADKALYAAKAAGRNMCRSWEPEV